MEFPNSLYIKINYNPDSFSVFNETCATSTPTTEFKMIEYEDFCKERKRVESGKRINFFSADESQLASLRKGLTEAYAVLTEKSCAAERADLIKECFELGCYVLYDRQILSEVIEKQKEYEPDYIIDFFRYVLRIFFRQYSSDVILTKNQCTDIKKLCEKILSANGSYNNYKSLLYKMSSKEIAGILRETFYEKG